MTTDWKRKLEAYLHDPPSKALDIRTHEERSEAAFRQAGFIDEEIGVYFQESDWAASAADRLPFPSSQAAGLQCAFDGVRNAFIHPLGHPEGKKLYLKFTQPFPSAELGIEGENSVQPCLKEENLKSLGSDEESWRARFFAHWRLWQEAAREKDYRFAFLPADTRIPDHTIWTHIQICSAFAGCLEDEEFKPAFLKFQIGPVQDFIAAARSIRDLWSGSYLLSWLIAAGLKTLSEEIGPDSVIYPNLCGQPLFDLHWRDELWSKIYIGSNPVWQSFKYNEEELLTPNLPNVFLSLVPQNRADNIAKKVKMSIQNEWKKVARAVWDICESAGLMEDEGGITKDKRRERYNSQVERFLSISYQITPWSNTIDEALELADYFEEEMPIQEAKKRVENVVRMATKLMPIDHRDARFYTDSKRKDKLKNIGIAWPIYVAYNSWCLDAVRHTRAFNTASGGWEVGVFNNKDSLTGKEEAVAGGRVWKERCDKLAGKTEGEQSDSEYGEIGALFRHDDWLCATTLIKRIWHLAYLAKEPWNLKVGSDHFKMPNTYGIAGHTPFKDCGRDHDAEEVPLEEKYFAVLSLDGDEIGKWISGEKTPQFLNQLAGYTDGSGNPCGALEYFTRNSNPDGEGSLKDRFKSFLETRRPLSPSYHLQFSGALSNFALYCVKPIVEVFDGRLIYAGGDDVLALLPFDSAVPCAQALRMAFRGDPNLKNYLTKYAHLLSKKNVNGNYRPYYQKLAKEGALLDVYCEGFLIRLDYTDYNDKPIPFIVPGPAADCSVGVAIAHYKAPLQDVVKAAKAAEKRAKKQLDRSAIAITLFKRSGEILEWGCKWESGGLELLIDIATAIENKKLSARFPYKVCEFVEKYISNTSKYFRTSETNDVYEEFEKNVFEIIKADFSLALDRQCLIKVEEAQTLKEHILAKLDSYLNKLNTYHKEHKPPKPLLSKYVCRNIIGLCQTIAFTYRAGDLLEKHEDKIATENKLTTQPIGNL
ncbi:MAG: type III-B CRISPR-associated protein Cas10/Cmr2 [Verrucomicrobiia bacterium]